MLFLLNLIVCALILWEWEYTRHSVEVLLIQFLLWFTMYTCDKLFRLINDNIYSAGALTVIFFCYCGVFLLNVGFFALHVFRFASKMLEVPI